MIPAFPEFKENSHEDIVFESLRQLPPNCYILHSLSIIDEENDKKETEIDFVVIIPDIGCVVIEAKSGVVQFTSTQTFFEGDPVEPYTWVYEGGRPMKGGGPFRQSRDNMYTLMQYLKKSPYSDLAIKQKFYSCVWFQETSKNKIDKLPLRPECPREMILSSDDLKTPMESLLKVIDYENALFKSTKRVPWNEKQAGQIVSNVLAPTMSLVPGKNWEYEYKTATLNKLLKEQEHILDFLSEQKNAVISGAAGTGKTMIALKKAEREADNNNKVLFLCFNSALSKFLSTNYKKNNIDYFNISQWACHILKSTEPDYGALIREIDKMILSESFPYQVIIVDEAQDFGQDIMDGDQVNVLDKLKEAMILYEGCFFLFYDKNQVVNSSRLPKCILDADCKLTLYRNCRNTKKIADASLKILSEQSKSGPNVLNGTLPRIIFADSTNFEHTLYQQCCQMKKQYESMVVLSLKSSTTTSCYAYVKNQNVILNGSKYPFFTCRQYKGLEADAVILVDVNANTFLNDANHLSYYVGASRAKFDLVIIANMTNDDCKAACQKLLGETFEGEVDYKELLAMALAITNE